MQNPLALVDNFDKNLFEEKVELIEGASLELLKELEAHTINNEADEQKASELLLQAKSHLKRLEQLRVQFKSPFDEAGKIVQNFFRAHMNPLESAETILKRKIADHYRKKELAALEEKRKREDEQRKLEAANAKKAQQGKPVDKVIALVEPVEAPQSTIRTTSGTVSVKKIAKWRVVNLQEARECHPDLFIIDEKKLNELVRQGERDFVGIEVYEEEVVAARA